MAIRTGVVPYRYGPGRDQLVGPFSASAAARIEGFDSPGEIPRVEGLTAGTRWEEPLCWKTVRIVVRSP